MTKRNKSTKRGSLRSRILTWISALIIGIITLIAAVVSDLIDLDPVVIEPDTAPPVVSVPGNVTPIQLGQGFGAQKDFWRVYFTAPTGSRDFATYVGGVDTVIVNDINNVQRTLDIAAFEWNVPSLTEAVINAHRRGVRVRMVVDREHTLESESSTIQQIIDAGIPVRDDGRTGFMHNKFMIMDSTTVWTGSMNYTMNDIYRNNNNAIALRSTRAVSTYTEEFEEMFVKGEFGSSRSQGNNLRFTQNGVPVHIMFSPEDPVVPELVNYINSAQSSIRFMTFSFTLDEIGQALLRRASEGINVEGIFELRGSRTQFSQLPPLFCAGLNIREDGNPFTFHHKVFIIDDHTVLTGSFNISANATNRNDENIVIIQDRDLAAQYLAEYDRVMAQSRVPPRDQITCP